MEIQLHMFLILSLDGSKWTASHAHPGGSLTPGERALDYSLDRILIKPKVDLGAMENRKIAPQFNGSSERSLVNLMTEIIEIISFIRQTM